MSVQKYNSFDVFDTLIGRICYRGVTIFDIMEHITGVKDFARVRRECETSPFHHTYERISTILSCDTAALQALEVQLEYEFSFPIWKYIHAVGKDDILISDMYLPDSIIRDLICKHTQFDNKLIVTSGGKASGAIWRDTSITQHIQLHIGDNIHSDYHNPRHHDVEAQHISNVDLNAVEDTVSRVSPELAYILRAVRLTTQHDERFFNSIAHSVMLPFSIMICLYIHSLIQKDSYEHILFLSRDGYWLHTVFQILFPNVSSHYVYFSRHMTTNAHELDTFIHSVNMYKGKKLFVDLVGSGNTLNKSIDRIEDATQLLCFPWNPSYPYNVKNIKILHTADTWIGKYMEDIFSAPHGTLNNDGTLLDPEYDVSLFEPYMNSIEIFSKYYSVYTKYIDITKNVRKEALDAWFELSSLNTPQGIERITDFITHVSAHDVNYAHFPLMYYSQIGQDKYYIENVIKFKCNGVFLDIGAYDGVTGSNTYYLEKNLHWKGLLVECNPDVANVCKQNRSSPLCEKAIFEESNVKINFTVPLGKEIEGGKAQLGGITEFLRQESLDHFKDSYKNSKIIQVDTIHINELLASHGMNVIDYMSLDVEGYELEVLKQIDFKKYKILYLTVEHAVPQRQVEIYAYLTSNGYRLARNNMWDDEYIFVA